MRSLFILAIVLVIGSGCSNPADVERSATENAKAFATSMGMEIKGAACSGSDSDYDGYTSCTLNMGDGQLQAIECGYYKPNAWTGQNTGCKLVKPVGVSVQTQ